MARRATILKKIRKKWPNALFLAGFYELSNYRELINLRKLDKLTRAFKKLGYDYKVLSKKEAMVLKKHGISLNSWTVNSNYPIIKHIFILNKKIYIIVLPEQFATLKNNSIRERLKKIQKNSDLIIAISPYGYDLEYKLLKKYHYDEDFDILLGSGKGPIFRYRLIGQHCVWIRPISQGKAIYCIVIKDFYNGTKTTLKDNIEVQKIYLTQDILPDKDIQYILTK